MQLQYVDAAGNFGIHNQNPHQQQNHFGKHQEQEVMKGGVVELFCFLTNAFFFNLSFDG